MDGLALPRVAKDFGRLLLATLWLLALGAVLDRLAAAQAQPLPGSLDGSFAVTIRGSGIYSVFSQSGARLVATGLFTAVNGVQITNLVRLQSDGPVDDSFTVDLGTQLYVPYAQPLVNEQILVTGGFETVNGVPRRRQARLQADGQLDLSYTGEVVNMVACPRYLDREHLEVAT